jgi:hypothetical protein
LLVEAIADAVPAHLTPPRRRHTCRSRAIDRILSVLRQKTILTPARDSYTRHSPRRIQPWLQASECRQRRAWIGK